MNINFIRLVALGIVGSVAKSLFGKPVVYNTTTVAAPEETTEETS